LERYDLQMARKLSHAAPQGQEALNHSTRWRCLPFKESWLLLELHHRTEVHQCIHLYVP